MANGENAMLGFLEEKDRVVVDGYCAQAICSFAQSIWIGLLKSVRHNKHGDWLASKPVPILGRDL